MDKKLTGLNGVFAVFKPARETSARTIDRLKNTLIRQALGPSASNKQLFKRLSRQIKVGHGGTLDPMATGVLVVGLNSGCKELSKYLTGSKSYIAEARFGEHYDTLDRTGKLLQRDEGWEEAVKGVPEIIPKFIGEAVMQVPPAFSAIHVNGKRAYEIARKESESGEDDKSASGSAAANRSESANEDVTDNANEDATDNANEDVTDNANEDATDNANEDVTDNANEDVIDNANEDVIDTNLPVTSAAVQPQKEASFDIPARPVAIHSITYTPLTLPTFRLSVSCGGGCYIRSLIRDIAAEVGTLAHMTELERVKQGIFTTEMCLREWDDLDKIEEAITKAKELI